MNVFERHFFPFIFFDTDTSHGTSPIHHIVSDMLTNFYKSFVFINQTEFPKYVLSVLIE